MDPYKLIDHEVEQVYKAPVLQLSTSYSSNIYCYSLCSQKALRAELYQVLMDHLANEAAIEELKPERVIILPSGFLGDPRAMQQNYPDAMAIVR
jgi:hypothetical protein